MRPKPHQAVQPSPKQERGPSTHEATVRKALLQIVMALEHNFHTREDLLQEALVHFWLSERQHPGQQLSWYLQRAKFHLHHLRMSGRSLDSPKHRGAQAAFTDNLAGQYEWLDMLDFDVGIMSEVNAHDIFLLLADRLEPIDQVILSAFAEGMGVCEIAEKLKVSHVFVI